MNKSKFDIEKMSQIEVEALFLQYNAGNRELIDRELLYAMIDWLKNTVIEEDGNNLNEIFGEID